MLIKKTVWFWKRELMAISIMITLCFTGCSGTTQEETAVVETTSEVQLAEQYGEPNIEKIIECCLDIYEKAADEKRDVDLEMTRSIINQLGKNGYPAVDSKNQIDMTEADKVVQFCKMVEAREESHITIIEVDYLGGLIKYDLQTKDGNVDVTRNYYRYDNGKMRRESTGSYQANRWEYTEEGYLMFSGAWFSEELDVLTLGEAVEYTALRVQPLDETCRELNRKYLLPISYKRNNMFLVDWSEDDFGELNFYDMYDILYPKVYGKYMSYAAGDNMGGSAVYRIPREEFENVIMTYFNIDSETLQSKTIYYSEDATYEYRPRGLYEVEYPEHPYPEVIGYSKNSDGTITLTVNVVFPYAGDSKVYSHEVVVRPLDNGGVQYVSNRIIPSKDNKEETWHTPRLTAQEWEEVLEGI